MILYIVVFGAGFLCYPLFKRFLWPWLIDTLMDKLQKEKKKLEQKKS